MMDALTGLQNRYYFEESLRETIAYQKRHSDYDFCLLLIDLDGFKNVNDSYGHLAGDELLKIVARILKIACVKAIVLAGLAAMSLLSLCATRAQVCTRKRWQKTHS